jgi:hypothetical protein
MFLISSEASQWSLHVPFSRCLLSNKSKNHFRHTFTSAGVDVLLGGRGLGNLEG